MESRPTVVARGVAFVVALAAMLFVAPDLRAASRYECPVSPPHLLGECFNCQEKCQDYWGPNAGWQCYGDNLECCGCPQ